MTNSLIEAAKGKLGQGIQALAANQSSAKTPELLITLINTRTQVRKEFEDAENPLSELANDIKERGILQPILVRPVQGQHPAPDGAPEGVQGQGRDDHRDDLEGPEQLARGGPADGQGSRR